MTADTDISFMRHALALGRRGLGQVAPWPSVGCVIVKDGHVVGRGVSDLATLRHAEVVALDQAGDRARGAAAYVTLEPCSHRGQTPPCADALISAGVARVVIAHEDPNPMVNGQGITRLRAAGLEVTTGVCMSEAARDHAGFFKVQRHGLPFLTLKLALSLDGRIATASGESQWITGPAARRMVHGYRARHDAVMVGAGTARADDPALTVRGFGQRRQPTRVVASRYLDIPKDGQLGTTARDIPVILLHGKTDTTEWASTGARCIEVPTDTGQSLSPHGMMSALASERLTRVFCEGGGALAASLLGAGLVDELVVFHAGLALGAEAIPGIGALGIDALENAPRFELSSTRAIGADTLSIWTPA